MISLFNLDTGQLLSNAQLMNIGNKQDNLLTLPVKNLFWQIFHKVFENTKL